MGKQCRPRSDCSWRSSNRVGACPTFTLMRVPKVWVGSGIKLPVYWSCFTRMLYNGIQGCAACLGMVFFTFGIALCLLPCCLVLLSHFQAPFPTQTPKILVF